MAVFDPKSRYVLAEVEPYETQDARGRTVHALPLPEPLEQTVLGDHERKLGERLDHVAASLLNDPHGFWRIAEANGALLPDALAQRPRLSIPAATRLRKRRA